MGKTGNNFTSKLPENYSKSYYGISGKCRTLGSNSVLYFKTESKPFSKSN